MYVGIRVSIDNLFKYMHTYFLNSELIANSEFATIAQRTLYSFIQIHQLLTSSHPPLCIFFPRAF